MRHFKGRKGGIS
ncbi:hypothetical protein YPPY101_3016, partial [Yersinia pestis PY-101]